MHDAFFYVVTSWIAVLVGVLAFRAVRATRMTDRVVALDTLSFMFVAALAIIAVEREQPGYLDIALMLALLSFTQTLSVSRYCLAGRVTP